MDIFAKFKDSAIEIFRNNKKFGAFVVLFYVITRLPVWFLSYDSDHWLFYYVGRNFVEGGVLYVDAWDHKPPMIFLFNGFLHLLFGSNLELHRAFMTVVSIISIVLFYKLAKFFLNKLEVKFNSEIAARIGVIVLIFWTNLVHFNGSGNNTENFALPFLLGMFLSYLMFTESKKYLHLLISGVCFGIIFYLKPNFSLFALPILVDVLINNRKQFGKLILTGVIFVLPLTYISGLWVYYFIKNNAFNDFIIASLTFSSKYLNAGWQGKVSPQLPFIAISSMLFVFCLPFLYSQLKNLWIERNNRYKLFLNLWLVAVIIFSVMLGTFYPNYYLVVVPCLAIVMALNIDLLKNGSNKLLKTSIIALILLTSLVSMGISYRQLNTSVRGSAHIQELEDKKIAEFVKSNSEPSDKIFANTYGATFYILCERESSSRFISASVLLLDYREKFGFNLNKTFLEDMEKTPARFVIYPKDKDSLYLQNKELVEYFNKNYNIVEFETENYYVLARSHLYEI